MSIDPFTLLIEVVGVFGWILCEIWTHHLGEFMFTTSFVLVMGFLFVVSFVSVHIDEGYFDTDGHSNEDSDEESSSWSYEPDHCGCPRKKPATTTTTKFHEEKEKKRKGHKRQRSVASPSSSSSTPKTSIHLQDVPIAARLRSRTHLTQ